MVYTSRPDASAARLAWDQFTILHDGEPLEMEPLAEGDMPEMWRFRYLSSSGRLAEVQLNQSGLESTGPPDAKKLLRIQKGRERAMRGRTWVIYLGFGVATLMAVVVILSGVRALRRPESPVSYNVPDALALLAMAWLMLAGRHLDEWWRRRTGLPRRAPDGFADGVFFMLAFGMWWSLTARG
jgi:hypothetical protein